MSILSASPRQQQKVEECLYYRLRLGNIERWKNVYIVGEKSRFILWGV
jgi:hypothetical protein